ncbi:MAG TPA: hypothetical protein VIP70_05210 [Nitrososphaeraceae archaeon]|jgi:Ca2+-binding RTX toxin-like protein
MVIVGDDKIQTNEDLDKLYRGATDDQLQGGMSNDELYGDEGNDILAGRIGNGFLVGETGNGKLYGGVEGHILQEAEGAADYFGCGEGIDIAINFSLEQKMTIVQVIVRKYQIRS